MRIIFLIIFLFIFFPDITIADTLDGGESSGGVVTLNPPIANATNPNILIGKVIQAVLSIVGSLALLMFVYGGLTWMMAAGNNERVQKGKDILMWATVGLVVIFSAYAAVRFIFTGLGVS